MGAFERAEREEGLVALRVRMRAKREEGLVALRVRMLVDFKFGLFVQTGKRLRLCCV